MFQQRTFSSTLLCLVTFLFLGYLVAGQTLVITVNRISLYNKDNITLTSANLQSTLNGAPSPSRIIYNVLSITNGQFQVLSGSSYVPTTQFTQAQLDAGNVRFSHPGNLQIPSYTLNAFDPLLGVTSASSVATVTFSAFTRNSIGAPRPVFEASIDPSTLVVTLRVTMFRRVLDSPEVNFNLGLSVQSTCLNSDLIRDGFALVQTTSWYNVYQFSATLNQFISNPNVLTISNGGVIDLQAVMFADYMVHTNTTGASTKTCYEVLFKQTYILTLTLALTRINFGVIGTPTSFMKPKKIFVNDLNKLEIRLEVWTAIQANATSWSVTGPYPFTVTDAVFTGSSGGFNYYSVVLQSNVITGATDFGGNYVLTLNTPAGSSSIPYTLQYLVPYPNIEEELVFSTSAQTYADAAFVVPKTQFSPTDTVFVKVDASSAPVIDGQPIIPYNVIMCCFLSVLANTSFIDCRNATRADFSTNIFVNGAAVRDVSATNIPVSNTTYGFSFIFPVVGRDNIDRRCYLTIESAYAAASLRSLHSTQSTVQSVTYRVFDVINGNTKAGAKSNNAFSIHAVDVWSRILLVVMTSLILFIL